MKRLVLIGAGHAHALVLAELAQKRMNDVEVVVVSPIVMAPYSGMIPGWLAGYYRWEDCCIDFAQLCSRAGVTLCIDSVVALDPGRSKLQLGNGQTMDYDWLSLNVGSTTKLPSGEGMMVLPMRPLSDLRSRWVELQQKVATFPPGTVFRILTIGGGAAGVETVLAVSHALKRLAPKVLFQFMLATDEQDILPSMAVGAARRLRQHLVRQSVEIINHCRAAKISHGSVICEDGQILQADAVLWATGARAYPWLRESGLSVDAGGFVRVDATLRSISHPRIFASGDCAGWEPPLPKAGVFSVRMGHILSYNLLAVASEQPMQPYIPQRKYLALIGTGDANAVAAWGAYSWQGQWLWRLKQAIDRQFVASCNAE